jgi:carbamoyl-phosphate synthase large subunit
MTTRKDIDKINILLIGGKGGTVAEGILKCLRLANYGNISLLEYTRQAALLYRVEKSIIIDKNPDDDYEYIQKLIEVSLFNGIDVIIPAATWEARVISKYSEEFHRRGLTPLVNNYDAIEICADKKRTFEYLNARGIGTPKTFSSVEETSELLRQKIPLIVKPISGRGSQNIFRAGNITELKAVVGYFEAMNIPYIIQENISSNDDEYTVGVISDKNGNVIQSIVMRRHLLGGATGYAAVCNAGYINRFCEHVAKEIRSTGPINVQLRVNKEKEAFVFEINPRFSGSAPMRALAGFNELDMIIRNYYLNQEIELASVSFGNQYFRVFQEIEIRPDSKKGQIINLL